MNTSTLQFAPEARNLLKQPGRAVAAAAKVAAVLLLVWAAIHWTLVDGLGSGLDAANSGPVAVAPAGFSTTSLQASLTSPTDSANYGVPSASSVFGQSINASDAEQPAAPTF